MKKFLTIVLFAFTTCWVLTSCANKGVTKESKAQMTGAYAEERSVSNEEMSLFKETYKGKVTLTPFSVSTQVVAGTNYKFICKDKEGNKYKVVIYQKLPCYGGESEVTSVEKL